MRAHKADELWAANGITSWILRQSKMHWKQARMIAKHHEERWTKLISNWNPAISTKQKGYRKQGRMAKRWEDDINFMNYCNQPKSRNKTAGNETPWKAIFVSRPKQPTRPTTRTKHTTKVHDHDEGGVNDDEKDDDETLMTTSPNQSKTLILTMTQATTNNQNNTQCSSDTLQRE